MFPLYPWTVTMIRVMIADDHPFLRKGLRSSLEEHGDLRVVAEAGSGGEVFAMVGSTEFDVLVLDISLPDISGIEVLKRLHTEKPQLRILMLSTYPEKQYAIRCLRAGALAYITKEAAPTELVIALRRVAEGRRYVSSGLASQLADMLAEEFSHLPHEDLSDREYEILCLFGKGMGVPEIASALTLSIGTVYTYRTRICTKMGLNSTPELVCYVLEHKLVSLV